MASQQTHLRAIVNQDGAAILDARAGSITTLNTAGGYVWQALERGEDIEAITNDLARQTGEQLETVKADVTDFIETLKQRDLLPR